jgi:hypothetical protein
MSLPALTRTSITGPDQHPAAGFQVSSPESRPRSASSHGTADVVAAELVGAPPTDKNTQSRPRQNSSMFAKAGAAVIVLAAQVEEAFAGRKGKISGKSAGKRLGKEIAGFDMTDPLTCGIVTGTVGTVIGTAIGYGHARYHDRPRDKDMVICGLLGAAVGVALGEAGLGVKNKFFASTLNLGSQVIEHLPAAAHQASEALQAVATTLVTGIENHPAAAAAVVIATAAALTYAKQATEPAVPYRVIAEQV